MIIFVSTDKVHFALPMPLGLVSIIGPIVIKSLPPEKLPQEIKPLILEAFPIIIKDLKKFRGMTLVYVETAKGEKVFIRI
ncbi:MAG TPA: hypothetical protein DG753_07450 [Clostridium sp.]|nr:hypothetical protein [Clostridium sp.]